MLMRTLSHIGLAMLLAMVTTLHAFAEEPPFIPRRQDKLPGPPLSPQEAIKKMTVPEGFSVELVASEPDIVNPVAMTFDEKGRVWITESLEYPRSEPGKGRDRVKVLEDTDGDGRADKFTIFAEGLNIPSGIAVGHGGVWVANAPDILFMQDTDGDLKADKTEVVVTGFGRTDTHELPNSLTWGPDGYLYGLNGVFNHSHVKHKGKEYRFTCALFRIDPRTRDFELFAEGTSNPWGIAWDPEGSAFVSACVIDHLWHLAETGYYHRQGGPYPPYTWKIGSIVKHKHQMAAYCGIHYFDSDAYPEKYRDRLYMGNIHGGCINSDALERKGSTYSGTGEPDFLTANDVWFMPVVQKTGPDGCLYVLDWYDRYHCYQDARRDPQGIDRLNGRLYRVRYKDTPRAAPFDLAKETNEQLIERLRSKNVFYRDLAQRVLIERDDPAARRQLRELVMDEKAHWKTRLHALWSLIGAGHLDANFHRELLDHTDPRFRAWGVRTAGNFGKVDDEIDERIAAMARDESSTVKLQVAIAAAKISDIDTLPVLLSVLATHGDDPLIPHIVWQNLHPLLETEQPRFLDVLAQRNLKEERGIAALLPRMLDRLLDVPETGSTTAAEICRQLIAAEVGQDLIANTLSLLRNRIETGRVSDDETERVRRILEPVLQPIINDQAAQSPFVQAVLLAALLRDDSALEQTRRFLSDEGQPPGRRVEALQVLASVDDQTALPLVREIVTSSKRRGDKFQGAVISALGAMRGADVAALVLEVYQTLNPNVRPRAVELLTSRKDWSRQLLEAIRKEQIPAHALNVNQVRKILAGGDADLVKTVETVWGRVRTQRDPGRENLIGQMRKFLSNNHGDPLRGKKVFAKVCGQCHKMHGEGEEVGPDITVNGRSSYAQLLSNVFDPSLVIGAGYQPMVVVTTKGKVLTGLIVENGPQRVVLKIQGGKLETIPRDQIEESKISELSMMPEGLEKQLKPQELADLFSFLTLDKPPEDPQAKRLPGAPAPRRKK